MQFYQRFFVRNKLSKPGTKGKKTKILLVQRTIKMKKKNISNREIAEPHHGISWHAREILHIRIFIRVEELFLVNFEFRIALEADNTFYRNLQIKNKKSFGLIKIRMSGTACFVRGQKSRASKKKK